MAEPNDAGTQRSSARFIGERKDTWRRLERIIATVEHSGIRTLTVADRLALPHLYRASLSSLSVARSIIIDRRVVEYLEQLARRAYFIVYAPDSSFRDSFKNYVLSDFPASVRAIAWPVFIAGLALFIGALTGSGLVEYDLNNYAALVPDNLAGDRTVFSSEEQLREALYPDHADIAMLELFSIALFTNNASVAIFAFSLGLALGIPTIALLFFNGCVVGAFISLFGQRNLGFDVFAWLSVHGTTELLAIILAGGAGLAIAEGVLFPSVRQSRLASIKARGHVAGQVLPGALMMLVLAALLEGFARQLIVNPWAKLAIGWSLAMLWLVYFVFVGRISPHVPVPADVIANTND